MKDDLKELKDCFTIHCLGEIDEKSYNFLIKKIERLENKALNMHIVGVRSEQFYCWNSDVSHEQICSKQCKECIVLGKNE